MEKSNIGMIGMGVMGENLVMNMLNHGFKVSGYDINEEQINKFINGRGKGREFFGTVDIKEFVNSLATPRKIMIMIKAGSPVDQTIEKLIPLLEKGDVIVDGGNSNYNDTIRRCEQLEKLGLNFVGMGVSGGEEGALNGPSLMPGGSKDAWEKVKEIFLSIAAKTSEGEPCCSWIGSSGAGHYVKMVHNGIEYGDMQLICESYDIMKRVLNIDAFTMSDIYANWNKTELDSYLIEITSNILKYKDTDGKPIVDKIMDRAGQKGTGKWASISALDEGIPLTLINEAVYARSLSALKEERVEASKEFVAPSISFNGNKEQLVEDLRKALYVSKIISYAQGFSLLRTASNTYNWDLNYGGIALTWRGGCIIRSAFLGNIKKAYTNNPNLTNLILDPFFKAEINKCIPSLRRVLAVAIENGISVPTFSAALSYFDGYTSERLPQNLLQAQRDYFGAHTYERIDAPKGKAHHTNWTGHGGDTTAGTYNA